jgi:thymidylate synthase (FAD)
MRLIKPTWELVRPNSQIEGIAALKFIERMARISHRSEKRQTEESWRRFLKFVVMERGDWSVAEHVHATVIFRINRGVTHELVRHRLFSYTQESTRFVNGRKSYPDGLEFITPATVHTESMGRAYDAAEAAYLEMLDAGIRPQEARAVLPNALASTIAVSGNFRAWRHLFLLRTTKETHPDFRQVTLPLLEEFQSRIPLLFDDIVPGSSQAESIRLAR